MRILHLSNHLHEIGNGIMNVVVDLACRQAELGHAVAVASGGGSFVGLLERFGVAHFEIAQPFRRPHTLARSALKLRGLFGRWEPDILHAHMMTGAILARALKPARIPLVATVHNEWQRSAVAMGVADRVIAVSAATAERMRRRGIPAGKIDVVLNAPLKSPRRPGGPDDARAADMLRPAILFVGGLYVRKGVSDLIDAFASPAVAGRHPDAQLYILGDGPDRDRFVAEARATGAAARIHFAGFVSEPRGYLRSADIFCLPSRSEPFGLVLAEAREAGCAVIGTDVGGIPEVLEHGRAGILTPPRRPAELAAHLARLLDDPAELAAWRARGRENLEWLGTERLARETIAVYDRAIADRHRHAGPGSGGLATALRRSAASLGRRPSSGP